MVDAAKPVSATSSQTQTATPVATKTEAQPVKAQAPNKVKHAPKGADTTTAKAQSFSNSSISETKCCLDQLEQIADFLNDYH